MDNILSDIASIARNNDKDGFDLTTATLLISVGAEDYIPAFKRQNIGETALVELNDDDLVKLGVEDLQIRKKLLKEFRSLPAYKKLCDDSSTSKEFLDAIDICDILKETSKQLHRIKLSFITNKLALKKDKDVSDCLLLNDKYASDIAISTLSEIKEELLSIEKTLNSNALLQSTSKSKVSNKKLVVAFLGSSAIAILSIFFARSLKNI